MRYYKLRGMERSSYNAVLYEDGKHLGIVNFNVTWRRGQSPQEIAAAFDNAKKDRDLWLRSWVEGKVELPHHLTF